MSVSVLDKLPYSLPCRVVKMANRLAGNLARCKLLWWNPCCENSCVHRSDNKSWWFHHAIKYASAKSNVLSKSHADVVDHVSDFKPNTLLWGFWGVCIHSCVGAEFDQKSHSLSSASIGEIQEGCLILISNKYEMIYW